MTITRIASCFIPIRTIIGFIIIASIYLGPPVGASIGFVSVLVSNFFVGHGLWTPFQLLAVIIIALLTGFIFKREKLVENKIFLLFWSIICVAIYSINMLVYSLTNANAGFWPVIISHFTVKIWIEFARLISTIMIVFIFTKPIGKIIKR
ncbi:MAG: ECF transporter S component [Lactobacillales bacterium]|nr:ECF transporter S component [Lactobacillales bacterium]